MKPSHDEIGAGAQVQGFCVTLYKPHGQGFIAAITQSGHNQPWFSPIELLLISRIRAKNLVLVRSDSIFLCVQTYRKSDKAQAEERGRSCAYNRPNAKLARRR